MHQPTSVGEGAGGGTGAEPWEAAPLFPPSATVGEGLELPLANSTKPRTTASTTPAISSSCNVQERDRVE